MAPRYTAPVASRRAHARSPSSPRPVGAGFAGRFFLSGRIDIDYEFQLS
jgi:hypothetical protein